MKVDAASTSSMNSLNEQLGKLTLTESNNKPRAQSTSPKKERIGDVIDIVDYKETESQKYSPTPPLIHSKNSPKHNLNFKPQKLNLSLTQNEIIDIIKNKDPYTPVTTPKEKPNLGNSGIIKLSSCYINCQDAPANGDPVEIFQFDYNNRSHKTALAKYIRYNKVNKNKDVYLLKAKSYPNIILKVSNPYGNDVFVTYSVSGDGSKDNPYQFETNSQKLTYKGIDDTKKENILSDSALSQGQKLLENILNIAERGRNKHGGILLQISQQKSESIPANVGKPFKNSQNWALSGPQVMQVFERGEIKGYHDSWQPTNQQKEEINNKIANQTLDYLNSHLREDSHISFEEDSYANANKDNSKLIELLAKVIKEQRKTPR